MIRLILQRAYVKRSFHSSIPMLIQSKEETGKEFNLFKTQGTRPSLKDLCVKKRFPPQLEETKESATQAQHRFHLNFAHEIVQKTELSKFGEMGKNFVLKKLKRLYEKAFTNRSF